MLFFFRQLRYTSDETFNFLIFIPFLGRRYLRSLLTLQAVAEARFNDKSRLPIKDAQVAMYLETKVKIDYLESLDIYLRDENETRRENEWKIF